MVNHLLPNWSNIYPPNGQTITLQIADQDHVNKYHILPFALKVVGIWWNGRRKLLKYEDFQEPYKIFQWFLCFGPRILVSYWVWTFPVTTDTNIFCHWNIFYIPGATNDMIDRCLQPNEISSNKIRLQIWSLFNLKKFISQIEKSY